MANNVLGHWLRIRELKDKKRIVRTSYGVKTIKDERVKKKGSKVRRKLAGGENEGGDCPREGLANSSVSMSCHVKQE